MKLYHIIHYIRQNRRFNRATAVGKRTTELPGSEPYVALGPGMASVGTMFAALITVVAAMEEDCASAKEGRNAARSFL